MTIRSLTLGLVAAALVPAGGAFADDADGPNLLENAGFEVPITKTYATFGNASRNGEFALDSAWSLKMFGCFCSPFNGNGAVSIYDIPVVGGSVYRVGAFALTPSGDNIRNGSWGGIKVEFKDASNTVIALAERRILEGYDPKMPMEEWVPADFLAYAPDNAVSAAIVPVYLQADQNDAGAMYIDDMLLASSKRNAEKPLINPNFDNGVDYQYLVFPTFNGWSEQYGNVFFDDFNFINGPHSAGMFGSFPDYDGDGQCDPGGVSGLGQIIPNIFEGDQVTLSMSAFTPAADSIVGTDNFVLQKIEFLGDDISAPIDSVAGTVMDGTGVYDNDTWHFAEISGTAPAGTTSIRIVAQIVQPDCGAGSIRIDDVDVTVGSGGGGPVACPGDFNDDGVVDGADFGFLFAAWGACAGCVEDLNNDGFVNGIDLGEFLAVWGDCPDDGGGGDPGGDPGDCPDCDCCEANGNTSCSDQACTDAVCQQDPICCQFGWDSICAGIAEDVCNGCEGP